MNVNNTHPAAARDHDSNGERGSAIIIAVLVLALMSVFVALALSRTTTEAMIMGNDAANVRANYAAQAGLETMTLKFNNLFRAQLNPPIASFTAIKNAHPTDFTADFDFEQEIIAPVEGSARSTDIVGGKFDGLKALQDVWTLTSKATHKATGAEIQLKRRFLNNRIPIFQFGAFFDDDLELHSGTPFYFRGRVHTNGHFFLLSGSPAYFDSRVSASGHIVRQVVKSGASGWGNDNINICPRNRDCQADSSYYAPLSRTEGSVLLGPDTGTVPADEPLPNGTLNTAAWETARADYRNGATVGNLENMMPKLTLPMKFNDNPNVTTDYIQLIKRGVADDANAGKETLRRSRYFNKAGLRITLSDSQTKLPGSSGGRRLDGASDGLGGNADADGSRGYHPPEMSSTYRATRMNGHRLYTGKSYDGTDRQTWIKIERVKIDPDTSDAVTVDVTEDILKLGLTERIPQDKLNLPNGVGNKFRLDDTGYTSGTVGNRRDERSIIKLQRFAMPGLPIKARMNSTVEPIDTTTATQVNTDPTFRRIENNISHHWQAGSPHATIDADRFMVRWRGQVQASHTTSGSRKYRFRVTSDDGIRVSVNDVLTIGSWGDKTSPGTCTNTFPNAGCNWVESQSSTAGDGIQIDQNGWVNFVVEYYEKTGPAFAKVQWSQWNGSAWTGWENIPDSRLRTATATGTTPGLLAEYFNNGFESFGGKSLAYSYVKLKNGEPTDPQTGATLISTPDEPFGYNVVTTDNHLLQTYTNSAEAALVEAAAHGVGVTLHDSLARFTVSPGVAPATMTPTVTTNPPVNHSVQGSGNNQFFYEESDDWGSNSSIHYSRESGSYFTFRFTGTKIELRGSKDRNRGIAGISIKSGSGSYGVESPVDLYSQTPTTDTTVYWTSPTLAHGTHTVRVRVTGTRKTSGPPAERATDHYIVVNSAVVTTQGTVTGNSTTSPGYTITSDFTSTKIVPFPIKMLDPREGLYNGDIDTMSVYPEKVPLMGLMSMIDIDMKNFDRYIKGDFNTELSADARSTALETDNNGWMIYVSDRRGDAHNNGELDMENIYANKADPNSSDTDQTAGEDANHNGSVEKDYTWEGTRYREGTSNGGRFFNAAVNGRDMVDPEEDPLSTGNVKNYATANTDIAALFDHRYYRRGVRLINGEQLPYKVEPNGKIIYRGFTLASENGVYVQGNYNAKGIYVPSPALTGPSPASHYCPGNPLCPSTPVDLASGVQVPASIVADAVTLLSKTWQDSQSFRDPFHERGRKLWHAGTPRNTWGITGRETTYRMAVLAGDTIESLCVNAPDGCDPNQGRDHQRMNGALHEGIIRFMEYFGEPLYESAYQYRLNYNGSLINLFNSRNNTGTFKVQSPEFTVFRQPNQNNTFDDSFTNPTRLPPGTPFFQYVQATGFIQDNTLQQNATPTPTPAATP